MGAKIKNLATENFAKITKKGVTSEQCQSIENGYLNPSKVEKICQLEDPNTPYDLDTLFELEFSAMRDTSNKMLVEDIQRDAEILTGMIKIDPEKLNIQERINSEELQGKPGRANMKVCVEPSGKGNEYVITEGQPATVELERLTSQLTGALWLKDREGVCLPSEVAMCSAKAMALRVLSRARHRPECGACVKGMETMTNSEAFKSLSHMNQLKALCYTTAALTQKDSKIQNEFDFRIWEMLQKGNSAAPDSLLRLEAKCKTIQEKIDTAKRDNKKIEKLCEINYKISLAREEGNLEEVENLKDDVFKNLVKDVNAMFEDLEIDENNVEKVLANGYCLYEGHNKIITSDIKYRGVAIFPDAALPGFPHKHKNELKPQHITKEAYEQNAKKEVLQVHSIVERIEYYKRELMSILDAYKKDQGASQKYPGEFITQCVFVELQNLRNNKKYLPMQDLKQVVLNILASESFFIEKFKQNKHEEIISCIKTIINKILQNRELKLRDEYLLQEQFNAKTNYKEEIASSVCQLMPIRNPQERQTEKDTEYSKQAELIQSHQKANGIKLPSDPDELNRQLDLLQTYTAQMIDDGLDKIAVSYHKLVRQSAGTIDDKIKVLAMANVIFAVNHNGSLPKSSQVAAVLAAINSESKFIAVSADPGSGKSTYITPVLMLVQQIGNRGQDKFPLFITNNETLLQQDYENFNPWCKAFQINRVMLGTNFESNAHFYTMPNTVVFGTQEMVMGDSLQLGSLNLAEYLEKYGKTKEGRGSGCDCLIDKVITLKSKGFDRNIVMDEYDTIKDKDFTGALIISQPSQNSADQWGHPSYEALFTVFDRRQGKDFESVNHLRKELVEHVKNQSKSVTNSQTAAYESQIDKLQRMSDKDLTLRWENLKDFVIGQEKNKYQLGVTYTIGYEVESPTNPNKKNVVAIQKPTQNALCELMEAGHRLKIYPINQSTSEIVQNAAFSHDATNFLSYMHGLPVSIPSVAVASTSAQAFFQKHILGSQHNVLALTATYGAGEMLESLVPPGTTNFAYKAPFELNLVEQPHQVFEKKESLYESAVNYAAQYIKEGRDVIILSNAYNHVYEIDSALKKYKVKCPDFAKKMDSITLASLESKKDHQIYDERVPSLKTPIAQGQREKGYVINATDACSRGFNFGASNAVLISVGIPSSQRGELQKKRRVARGGDFGATHSLVLRSELPQSLSIPEGAIDHRFGCYTPDVQKVVSEQLKQKESRINTKANCRREIQETFQHFTNAFNAYNGIIRILKSIKLGNDLVLSKPINDALIELVKDFDFQMVEANEQKWIHWRTEQMSLLESMENERAINDHVRVKLIKNWEDFVNKMPYYLTIKGIEITHTGNDLPGINDILFEDAPKQMRHTAMVIDQLFADLKNANADIISLHK